MSKQKPELVVITALAAAQVLHEAMDDLQDTNFYRQDLKKASKNMERKLTKVLDEQIAKMWGIDEEIMRSIQNGITEVAKELASMDPAKIAMLGELFKEGAIKFEENAEHSES